MPLLDWDELNSKKNYVTLKDGDSVSCVPRGKLYKYFSMFGDKKEYQEWVEGRSARFKINLLVKTDNGWEPRIFNSGKETFNRIGAAILEHGKSALLKISRSGSGKRDTSYKVEFVKKLTQGEMDAILKVKIYEFGKREEPEDEIFDEVPTGEGSTEDTLPF